MPAKWVVNAATIDCSRLSPNRPLTQLLIGILTGSTQWVTIAPLLKTP